MEEPVKICSSSPEISDTLKKRSWREGQNLREPSRKLETE